VKIIPRKILVKSSYEPIYEEQIFIIFLSFVWLFTKIRYKTFAIKFLCFLSQLNSDHWNREFVTEYSVFSKKLRIFFAKRRTFTDTENICSTNGVAQEKGKTGWNSVYHENWWKKLVCIIPVVLFLQKKISLPVMHLMPYSQPANNGMTLWITLYYCVSNPIRN